MKTKLMPAGDRSALARAADLLREGRVIALPTDTVYGVAADGMNPAAIESLFVVKDRPRDKAIPLLLADAAELDRVAAALSESARALAARFWPGGLTLVVRARPELPAVLRADGDTVAVRVPDHPVPRDLAQAIGRPLAATSANISAQASPASAGEVLEQLSGRIPLILDGGRIGHGVPSTVVDLSGDQPLIVRLGEISREAIEAVLRVHGTALARDSTEM